MKSIQTICYRIVNFIWELFHVCGVIFGQGFNSLRLHHVNPLPHDVTLQLLKEYLAKQSDRLKPSSLGHRIRFIRSLFRFAYEETYLTSNPSLKLREPKMDKRIPKFLIEEDVINLKISCLSLRERAILEFLYSTGCRVGEVQKINIEDLNWENCSAIVNGKGSKQREVYFTTECKVWLKKYLVNRQDSCKALFVTDKHPTRRMAIPTIRWESKRLANRGKIGVNVYPHRFRHTYACQLLDNGAPLDFIQGMLGHEKASTTQIYAQLRGECRRELYRRYF
ncbi:integrase [Paenibacillus tyrfis]|uniref:Integrase n=2 Tax=Paenibacillus tyrfis TaxID=1501230 RepID=A0A081P5L2_9BACL|nr:integrase [Paenibacillus tyrfis]